MEPITIFLGIMGLFAMLPGGQCFDQRKRILQGKTGYLSAKMEDIEGETPPSRVRYGTKRKADDDLSHWMDEGQKLVTKAENLLSQGGGGARSFFKRPKLTWDVNRLADALEVHDKKGDVLLKRALSVAQGPCRGGLIPVKPLVGQRASSTLKQLELLVQDEKVGRIAIHGLEGVGKTFLMKHLYNSVLNWVDRFEHVFWVTFPDHCTIKNLQDAVAAVVKCDFASNDNLNVRARKLSDKLAGLVSFVLFLDGVLGADFALDQVGIPVLAEGSKCKLVATTSSTLECRLLNGFKAVKVDSLPMEEAYELFVYEARIGAASDSSLGDTPRLLADRCCGLPRTIVDVGTRMCGIDDPRERNYALFESRIRGENSFYPLGPAIHQLE